VTQGAWSSDPAPFSISQLDVSACQRSNTRTQFRQLPQGRLATGLYGPLTSAEIGA
jgi:hypothetical protein